MLAPSQDQIIDLLDFKLHDIPTGYAVKTAASMGESNDGSCGGRTSDVGRGSRGGGLVCPPKLVAVTTLTSLNQDDFNDLGGIEPLKNRRLPWVSCDWFALMLGRARMKRILRKAFPEALLVTPGRMPSGCG